MIKKKIKLNSLFSNRYLIIFLSYFLLLSYLIISNLNIYNLNTYVMDLGIFSNQLYNLDEYWWRGFSGHFYPISNFLSLLTNFNKFIHYFLLNFQNLILIITFILIKKIYGNTLSIFFLLSPLVWFTFKDFHYDTIVLPLHCLVFLYYYKNKIKTAYFFLTLTCFVKEVFVIHAIFFMIFFSFEKIIREKKLNSIIFEILLIFFYIFIYLTQYYISYILFFEDENFNNLASFKNSFGETAYQNLKLISDIDLNFEKVKFLLFIFGFFLFFPLFKLKKLILFLPTFLIVLISNNPNHYDYTNHYTIGILIPFIDTCAELKKKYDLKKLLLIAGLIFNILFSYSPLSRFFWHNKIKNFHYSSYFPKIRNVTIKKALQQYIPEDKIISSQNSVNYYKISNGYRLFPFPEATSKPKTVIKIVNNKITKTEVFADYVVIDLKKIIFYGDKGCDYVYGTCKDKEILFKFQKALKNLNQNYSKIFEFDSFFIYKKL